MPELLAHWEVIVRRLMMQIQCWWAGIRVYII